MSRINRQGLEEEKMMASRGAHVTAAEYEIKAGIVA